LLVDEKQLELEKYLLSLVNNYSVSSLSKVTDFGTFMKAILNETKKADSLKRGIIAMTPQEIEIYDYNHLVESIKKTMIKKILQAARDNITANMNNPRATIEETLWNRGSAIMSGLGIISGGLLCRLKGWRKWFGLLSLGYGLGMYGYLKWCRTTENKYKTGSRQAIRDYYTMAINLAESWNVDVKQHCKAELSQVEKKGRINSDVVFLQEMFLGSTMILSLCVPWYLIMSGMKKPEINIPSLPKIETPPIEKIENAGTTAVHKTADWIINLNEKYPKSASVVNRVVRPIAGNLAKAIGIIREVYDQSDPTILTADQFPIVVRQIPTESCFEAMGIAAATRHNHPIIDGIERIVVASQDVPAYGLTRETHIETDRYEMVENKLKHKTVNIPKLVIYDPETKTPTDNLDLRKYRTLCTCKKTHQSVGPIFKNENGDTIVMETYTSCPINSIAAISRLVSELRPDPLMLEDYVKFLKNDFFPFVQYRMNQLPDEMFQLEDFEEFLKEVDPSKRDKYRAGYNRYFEGPIEEKERYGTWFPKTGETSPNTQSNINNKGRLSRPRPIWDPPAVYLCLTWYARLFNKILKKIFPWIVHGVNIDELEAKLNENLPVLDTILVSTDKTSHDGNQHPELIENVDHPFNSMFADRMRRVSQPIPIDIMDMMINELYNPVMKGFAYYRENGKRYRLFELWSKVVASGHPTLTFTGHCERGCAEFAYVMHRAGYKNIELNFTPNNLFGFVISGDDSGLAINSDMYARYKKALLEVASMTNKGVHGLGQCLKMIEENDQNFLSFLSKHCFNVNEKWHCYRQLHKILLGQNITDQFKGYGDRHDLKIAFDMNTLSLSTAGIEMPIIQELASWRAKYMNLDSLKKYSKYATQKNWYKAYCNYKAHKTDLDYFQIEQGFYKMWKYYYDLDPFEIDATRASFLELQTNHVSNMNVEMELPIFNKLAKFLGASASVPRKNIENCIAPEKIKMKATNSEPVIVDLHLRRWQNKAMNIDEPAYGFNIEKHLQIDPNLHLELSIILYDEEDWPERIYYILDESGAKVGKVRVNYKHEPIEFVWFGH